MSEPPWVGQCEFVGDIIECRLVGDSVEFRRVCFSPGVLTFNCGNAGGLRPDSGEVDTLFLIAPSTILETNAQGTQTTGKRS